MDNEELISRLIKILKFQSEDIERINSILNAQSKEIELLKCEDRYLKRYIRDVEVNTRAYRCRH